MQEKETKQNKTKLTFSPQIPCLLFQNLLDNLITMKNESKSKK